MKNSKRKMQNVKLQLKTKNFIIISAVLLFALCALSFNAFAQGNESLTITTYYPSPYGNYNELRSVRVAIGPNYVNNSTVCWAASGACSGGTDPGTASLVVENPVGIGTASPLGLLQVGTDRRLLINPNTGSATFNDIAAIDAVTSDVVLYGQNGKDGNGSSIVNTIYYDSGKHYFRGPSTSAGNNSTTPLMTIDYANSNISMGMGTPPTWTVGMIQPEALTILGTCPPFTHCSDFSTVGPQAGHYLIATGGRANTVYRINNDPLQSFVVGVGNDLGPSNFYITSQLWSNKLLTITQPGNVGIGTTSPAYTLDVQGHGHFDGYVYADAFIYNSDASLKKDVRDIPDALNKVTKLHGVNFRWRKNNEVELGLTAQEVEKVFPELVVTNKNTGLKSVKYGNLIAPLVEAVKQQQKQIEKLEKRIEELEKAK